MTISQKAKTQNNNRHIDMPAIRIFVDENGFSTLTRRQYKKQTNYEFGLSILKIKIKFLQRIKLIRIKRWKLAGE